MKNEQVYNTLYFSNVFKNLKIKKVLGNSLKGKPIISLSRNNKSKGYIYNLNNTRNSCNIELNHDKVLMNSRFNNTSHSKVLIDKSIQTLPYIKSKDKFKRYLSLDSTHSNESNYNLFININENNNRIIKYSYNNKSNKNKIDKNNKTIYFKWNIIKNEYNYIRIYNSFSELKQNIYLYDKAYTIRKIKLFLIKNGILDLDKFSNKNYKNLINYLMRDFSKKIDKALSIKENIIKILNGRY